MPTIVPMLSAAAAAATATSSEVRVPCASPAATSRPSRSVPSGCAASVKGWTSGGPTIASGSPG